MFSFLRRFGCGLVVLSMAVTWTGCGGIRGGDAESPMDELRTEISKVVTDPERQTNLLLLCGQYQDLIGEFAETLRVGSADLNELVSDYNSTPESFDQFFERLEVERWDLASRAIDIHIAMKESTTDEEWKSLTKKTQKVAASLVSQRLTGHEG